MARHLEQWQCATCGRKYQKQEGAEACEKVVPAVYPVGCMYSHYAARKEDTFAVAVNRMNGHQNNGGSWWSRDENAGKAFVGHEHTCADGSGQLKLEPSDRHVDLDLPSCQRMIEWLKSQGITPTVWDGEKAISLEEARKCPKDRWRYSTGFGTYPQFKIKADAAEGGDSDWEVMHSLRDVEVGDYIEARIVNKRGDRNLDGAVLTGQVTDIGLSSGSVKLESGWCVHTKDDLLVHRKTAAPAAGGGEK